MCALVTEFRRVLFRSRWRPNRCRRARRAQEGCCDKAGCCSSSDCSRAGPYSPSMDMPDTPAAELRPTLDRLRSEEHTSELQPLMRISYAVFCLKKKKIIQEQTE